MKHLQIRCSCGETRTFEGRNAQAIMDAIDAAGWTDASGGGPGWTPGHCDRCNRQGWADQALGSEDYQIDAAQAGEDW